LCTICFERLNFFSKSTTINEKFINKINNMLVYNLKVTYMFVIFV
jgi:hypothetical protein